MDFDGGGGCLRMNTYILSRTPSSERSSRLSSSLSERCRDLIIFVVVVIWFGFLVSRNVRTDWCGCKNVYVFMCLVVCCVCAKKKYAYMLVWYDQVAMEHVISIIHVICIRVYCSHVNWFNVFFGGYFAVDLTSKLYEKYCVFFWKETK